MVTLGWWLSSEEHDPRDLVGHARLAEDAGFSVAMISDHLHPWVRSQGHAPNVWVTLGAIAQATDTIRIGTGVTAMVHRAHPINVAHSAATAAVLSEGRFFLGVGTGERLNEQAFGRRWPRPHERRQRLEEAIGVLRGLFGPEAVVHDGRRWTVEYVELFDRPAAPPPIYVAAGGRRSAELAGRIGDGVIGVTPDARIVDGYRGAGGAGPMIAQLHVSLAADTDAAADNAWRWWPNGAVAPALLTELSRPEHFEAAARGLRPDALNTVICATGAAPIVAAIGRFVAAGFDTVILHQIGPDQQRLADVAKAELLPAYATATVDD